MYEIIKNLQFSEKNFHKIKKHCKLRKIEFMLSCFDTSSIPILKKVEG